MSERVPINTLPLFAEVAKARAKDPESSHEAARQATRNLRDSQEAVLRLFRVIGEMTDEQLVEEYQSRTENYPSLYPMQTASGLRTRRHELVEQLLIVYSGRRDESVGDRRVKPRIWRIAAAAMKESA